MHHTQPVAVSAPHHFHWHKWPLRGAQHLLPFCRLQVARQAPTQGKGQGSCQRLALPPSRNDVLCQFREALPLAFIPPLPPLPHSPTHLRLLLR